MTAGTQYTHAEAWNMEGFVSMLLLRTVPCMRKGDARNGDVTALLNCVSVGLQGCVSRTQ